MTARFEVLRPDGKVAVSSVYPHYRFVKKIRGRDNFWDASGQAYSKHVIVAFRPVVLTGEYESYRFSRGASSLWIGAGGPPPAGATLSLYASNLTDAYIYDLAPGVAGNSGLQVFSPDGQMTFDALGRYMILLDVLSGESTYSSRPWVNAISTPIVRTYPGGSMLAVVPLKQGFHIDFDRDAEEQSYGLTWQGITATEVRTAMIYYQENYYGNRTGTNQHLWYNTLVVDVSNVEAL